MTTRTKYQVKDKTRDMRSIPAAAPHTRTDGVRDLDQLLARCRLDEETGCMVYGGPTRRGQAMLWVPGHGSRSLTTALSIIVHGELTNSGRRWVANCGNCLCANPHHRRWKTARELALMRRSSNSPLHKAKIAASVRAKGHSHYTPELAAQIRASGEVCQVWADRIGVSASTISKIRRGEMWRDFAPGSSAFSAT